MIDLETYLKAQLTKLYGGKKKNNLDDFQCLNHEQENQKNLTCLCIVKTEES